MKLPLDFCPHCKSSLSIRNYSNNTVSYYCNKIITVNSTSYFEYFILMSNDFTEIKAITILINKNIIIYLSEVVFGRDSYIRSDDTFNHFDVVNFSEIVSNKTMNELIEFTKDILLF